MTSCTDKTSAGNSRAAHSTGKGSGQKKTIVIMYPNEQSYMPKDSVNIEKHTNLITCVITEYAKLRKMKDPTPIPIIYDYNKPMNTFKRILLIIHFVMPATYAIDYGIRMI
jgi:hypothetical protein